MADNNNIPSTLPAQVELIKDVNRATSLIAVYSKREKKVIAPSDPKHQDRYNKLNKLLSWFESDDFKITPELKQGGNIPRLSQVIFAEPDYTFPDDYKTRAGALLEKFEAQNWGAALDLAIVDPTSDVDDEPESGERPAKRRRSTIVSQGAYDIIQPPSDHPVWGVNGIMHGIALRRYRETGRLRKILNPFTKDQQRSAKTYGHNGLAVGSWFASFANALFRGAHGAWQAGITGHVETGAFSVVVSGMYEDLDRDEGSVLFYSGSGSHDNTDRNLPGEPTRHTQALHASMRTQKPIRVLRTSRGRGEWSPVEGVRYDGLYIVVSKDEPRNTKGGKYERFKLERLPGQVALSECKLRPSPAELKAYNRIVDGFGGYRLS